MLFMLFLFILCRLSFLLLFLIISIGVSVGLARLKIEGIIKNNKIVKMFCFLNVFKTAQGNWVEGFFFFFFFYNLFVSYKLLIFSNNIQMSHYNQGFYFIRRRWSHVHNWVEVLFKSRAEIQIVSVLIFLESEKDQNNCR
jgi:hypothetical protein